MKIIDKRLLKSFSGEGFCELCGKRVRKRDPNHIFTRGFGGGTRLDVPINLIALCATFSGGDNCHHRFHQGEVSRGHLLSIVAKRERRTVESIIQEIHRLQRQPKE